MIICFGSVGLYLFGRDQYSEHEIQRLIERAYSSQRPGAGRLSKASYSSIGRATPTMSDLGRAQILLLRGTNSRKHQRLQGLVYLAAGDWQKFVEFSTKSSFQTSSDPAFLNNLGASYLALAENDPVFLLNAVEEF